MQSMHSYLKSYLVYQNPLLNGQVDKIIKNGYLLSIIDTRQIKNALFKKKIDGPEKVRRLIHFN